MLRRPEISLCEWLALRRCESPLRLGASRRVPSRTDCLVERRVHRLVAVFVLRETASRPAAPSHVRVLAWGNLPPAITLSQFFVRTEGGERRAELGTWGPGFFG